MEEIVYQKSYEEFKGELDHELQKTAEGFVKIGYLLKVARDTNILAESQYNTVTEFAEAEYGLNATYVSRFISINDRFAKDGYSDELDDKYKGYGYAKLTIMLQLPDSMTEELSPDMSKGDIEAVKSEFDAEKQVTDLERYIEGGNPLANDLDSMDEHTKLMHETILALGEAEPELYVKVAAVEDAEQIPLVMVGSDTRVYSVRVLGKGRMMLTCTEEKVSIVNSRTGEKDEYTWSDIAAAWTYAGIEGEGTPIEKWEARYQKPYPIAPVQKEEHTPKQASKPKKESKVVKAKLDKVEHTKETQKEPQEQASNLQESEETTQSTVIDMSEITPINSDSVQQSENDVITRDSVPHDTTPNNVNDAAAGSSRITKELINIIAHKLMEDASSDQREVIEKFRDRMLEYF